MTLRNREMAPTDGELKELGDSMASQMAVSFRKREDGTIYAANPDGTEVEIPRAVAVPGSPGKSSYELYVEEKQSAGEVPLSLEAWNAAHFGEPGKDGEDSTVPGPPGVDSKVPGPPGKDGIVPMYGADGTLWKGVIDVEFEAVTDSNGRWQVDYSSFGFTATPRVHPVAWFESASPADQAITGGASKSKTHASGRIVRGVSGSLLGLSNTWRFVPAGTPVTVTVTGPTR